jgi:hypothetical protein
MIKVKGKCGHIIEGAVVSPLFEGEAYHQSGMNCPDCK